MSANSGPVCGFRRQPPDGRPASSVAAVQEPQLQPRPSPCAIEWFDPDPDPGPEGFHHRFVHVVHDGAHRGQQAGGPRALGERPGPEYTSDQFRYCIRELGSRQRCVRT